MEFQDVVTRRHMVRSFRDEPLPPGALDRILENARRAPSAGFSQGWAFVVLEGADETTRFWDVVSDAHWRAGERGAGLTRAPVIVLPLAHKQAYLDRYQEPDKAYASRQDESAWTVPYWDVDTGFAALLMLLTVTDLDLGALFFAIPKEEEELRRALGVPDDYRPIGAIAIGHPDRFDRLSPSLQRGHRPHDEVIHRGGW